MSSVFRRGRVGKFRYWREEIFNARFIARFNLDVGPYDTPVGLRPDSKPNHSVWLRNVDRLIAMTPPPLPPPLRSLTSVLAEELPCAT